MGRSSLNISRTRSTVWNRSQREYLAGEGGKGGRTQSSRTASSSKSESTAEPTGMALSGDGADDDLDTRLVEILKGDAFAESVWKPRICWNSTSLSACCVYVSKGDSCSSEIIPVVVGINLVLVSGTKEGPWEDGE